MPVLGEIEVLWRHHTPEVASILAFWNYCHQFRQYGLLLDFPEATCDGWHVCRSQTF